MANIADPDQTSQNAALDQGLHCLQMIELFFSRNIYISQPDVWYRKLKLDSSNDCGGVDD